MTEDISQLLEDWPYEPGQVMARVIMGDDGKPRIQLRLDLGILQMEVDSRPDGARPHGAESLLAHYERQLDRWRDEHNGDRGFKLDEQACELLRSEGVMYYHRYLAQFVLRDFEAVERDTLRNLRLMDFFNAYAAEESDRYVMEQYRPYVLMMCARARAYMAIDQRRFKAALALLRNGIAKIKECYVRYGQEELLAESGEIATLRAMAKDVEARIPVNPVLKLRRELGKAVQEERYEDAARLRDQLRQKGPLKRGDKPRSSPPPPPERPDPSADEGDDE